MKKKIRFKSRNNFAAPFFIAVSICLAGATLNSFLFYKSFFRALIKLNEQPIATITFKYKTAQRKFLERVVWDRLKQNSPVYNGDTIHTSALSEATIWFTDGNIMDLQENTMAQVFLDEDNLLEAQLSGGSARVDSTDSTNGLKLSTGGVEVSVKSGSALNASSKATTAEEGGATFQVLKGEAAVTSEKGSTTITEGEAVSVEGETIALPALVVKSPLPNEKILYHTVENQKVGFTWNTNNLPENAEVVLTIASDKDFSNVKSTTSYTSGSSADIELDSGTYYYKLTAEDSSVEGKFQLIKSLPPELITPVDNYEYHFRSRLPAVRITWTESPYSSTYNLKISKNENMSNPIIDLRTPMTSSIISTLEEGTYFYQVTPYYTINKEGFSASSNTGTFTIKKQGDLQKVALLLPTNKGSLDIEDTERGASFSWKHDDEAVSYKLRVSNNQDLSSPIIEEQTENNYLTLHTQDYDLTPGTYYWGVQLVDMEANESPLSDINVFYAMRGKSEQRTIEPLESYKVAQNLVQDTTFTWKKNLPPDFTTEIQFSNDREFSRIYQTTVVNGLSFKGLNLDLGSWYWRLYSYNSDKTTEMTTVPKQFEVQGPLPAAVQTDPLYRLVARETTPSQFTWENVEGADFYKFKLYKNSDNSLVYEDNVYGTELSINLFGKEYEDKAFYRWEIQPQSNAIPQVSSRRTGLLSEKQFQLLKLKPVEVAYPKKNAVLDGVESILTTPVAEWASVDRLAEAQFVLTRTDVYPPQEILRIPSDEEMLDGNKVAPNKITLETEDGLHSGTYEIIVHAKTLDGIDISNTEKSNIGRFSISEIEPLENARNLKATPALLNAQYIIANNFSTKTSFSWEAVKNATSYKIEIAAIEKKNVKVLYSDEIQKEPTFSLDLAKVDDEKKKIFSKGNFIFKVTAIRRVDTNKDGVVDKILQESPGSQTEFAIDIPSPKKAEAKGATNPYGK